MDPSRLRKSSPLWHINYTFHHNGPYTPCYRLSKRPNCFRGTCSGLGTWQLRCTKGASSGTRHIVLSPFLSLIAPVTVVPIGGVSPMTPVSSTTRASVRVPVPFPQLSLHVPSYRPITPNPCALGQQVTVVLSRLIVLSPLVYVMSYRVLLSCLPSCT